MSSERWRLSAESVTAIAAVLTAVIALAVGVWQTAETRRHNRLSVRPLLDFKTRVAMTHPDSATAVFEVTNRGLGLADLEDVQIRVQTLSGGEETYSAWTPALPAIQAYGAFVGTRSDLSPGTLVEPGTTITVLDLRSFGQIPADSLLQIIDRIDVTLKYKSLYDEIYEASLKGERVR